MQAWQALARAGLADGDAAAPQAAAPRPLGNAADVAAARGCPHSAPGRAPCSPRQSPFGELCVSALHLAPPRRPVASSWNGGPLRDASG